MKDEIALPSLTNITRESMSPQPQRFRVPVPPPLPPVNQIHTSTISPRVSLRPSNTSISSDEVKRTSNEINSPLFFSHVNVL